MPIVRPVLTAIVRAIIQATLRLAQHVEFVVVAVFLGLEVAIVAPAATTAGIVLPRLVVGDDAEIVVRELQVVLGLHPVAVMGGVLCQLLVLVEHLRGIAARPAVDPVELGAIAALITVTAPTTTVIPVIIVVIIQGSSSLSVTRCKKMPARAVNRPLVPAPYVRP